MARVPIQFPIIKSYHEVEIRHHRICRFVRIFGDSISNLQQADRLTNDFIVSRNISTADRSVKCTAIGPALDTCPDTFQAVGENYMRHPFSCRSSFSSVAVALFEELVFVKVVFFLLALALLLALAAHRCLSKRLVYWHRGCFWLAVSRSTAFGRRRCRATTFLLDRPTLDLNFDTTTTVFVVVVIFKHGVPNDILTAVVFELGRIKAVS